MHIAIEGLDGVGKTETAKKVAELLKFEFIEKPLHFFTDEEGIENYLKITERINSCEDKVLRCHFYGMGNLIVSKMSQNKNVVTDRHLASNYYWNYTLEGKGYFEELVNNCGKPDYTFILYATPDERRNRMKHRNPHDNDLNRDVFSDEPYEKIKKFIEEYGMNAEIIDTSELSLKEVVEKIVCKILG